MQGIPNIQEIDLASVGLGTTFFLSVVSPALVSAATPFLDNWLPAVLRSPIKTLVAVVITSACTLAGFWFDGKLTFPLPDLFWIIMLSAFGLQQLIYGALKSTILNGISNIIRGMMGEEPTKPVKKRKPRKPKTKTTARA